MITEATSKLQEAFQTTEEISALSTHAAHILREGYDGKILLNAWGILTDPQKRRQELLAAQQDIATALRLLDGGTWPSRDDYEKL